EPRNATIHDVIKHQPAKTFCWKGCGIRPTVRPSINIHPQLAPCAQYRGFRLLPYREASVCFWRVVGAKDYHLVPSAGQDRLDLPYESFESVFIARGDRDMQAERQREAGQRDFARLRVNMRSIHTRTVEQCTCPVSVYSVPLW